ncbi:hypothetical protein ABEG18_20305 [Alsobacter sp. KACC 23698]|uniref:Nitrate reductase n=1 Tax=Alsobacter sp. KACC 23698 TaxID=3149229 RepID=A0AAU7JCP6_9HYPH
MLSGLLDRFRRSKPDPEDVARVKGWVIEALALGPDDRVTVNEIACTDPACPGLETVVLVMASGEKTRAVKIKGGLITVTRPQVMRACLDNKDTA